MFGRLKRKKCSHEFRLCDLRQTGIAEPPPPKRDDGAEAWMRYYRSLPRCLAHTHRVEWPCRKCGKKFWAHCGLDITPKYGHVDPTQPSNEEQRDER